MIIETQLVAAARCHQCGRVLKHSISLFRLRSGVAEAITCSCGSEHIYVGFQRSNELSVRIPCSICNRTHFITIPMRPLLRGEVHSINCPVTMLDMGFIGRAEDVISLVDLWEEELEEELLDDWADYFERPEIMYEILDRLHTLAETGELQCNCGSTHIEMEIFPDRLELYCDECGQEDSLPAVDDEDLLRLRTLQILGNSTEGSREISQTTDSDFIFRNR